MEPGASLKDLEAFTSSLESGLVSGTLPCLAL